jgi:hypothetical protein
MNPKNSGTTKRQPRTPATPVLTVAQLRSKVTKSFLVGFAQTRKVGRDPQLKSRVGYALTIARAFRDLERLATAPVPKPPAPGVGTVSAAPKRRSPSYLRRLQRRSSLRGAWETGSDHTEVPSPSSVDGSISTYDRAPITISEYPVPRSVMNMILPGRLSALQSVVNVIGTYEDARYEEAAVYADFNNVVMVDALRRPLTLESVPESMIDRSEQLSRPGKPPIFIAIPRPDVLTGVPPAGPPFLLPPWRLPPTMRSGLPTVSSVSSLWFCSFPVSLLPLPPPPLALGPTFCFVPPCPPFRSAMLRSVPFPYAPPRMQ